MKTEYLTSWLNGRPSSRGGHGPPWPAATRLLLPRRAPLRGLGVRAGERSQQHRGRRQGLLLLQRAGGGVRLLRGAGGGPRGAGLQGTGGVPHTGCSPGVAWCSRRRCRCCPHARLVPRGMSEVPARCRRSGRPSSRLAWCAQRPSSSSTSTASRPSSPCPGPTGRTRRFLGSSRPAGERTGSGPAAPRGFPVVGAPQTFTVPAGGTWTSRLSAGTTSWR